MTKDIAHVVMRDGAMGYEVPADSAWCDQAVIAGLACKVGMLLTNIGRSEFALDPIA